MKIFLTTLFFILPQILFSQSDFFNDIGVFSGVNFNRSTRVELFHTAHYGNETHFFHGHNMNRQKHFFMELNTNIFNYEINRKSQYNSWMLTFDCGLFYTETQRNINIIFYLIGNQENSDVIINDWDNLYYEAKSRNIGLSNTLLFQKRWSKYFVLGYGITHRMDYAVSSDLNFIKLPSNDAWKETPDSNWDKFKTKLNQDIMLTFSPTFFVSRRLSLGIRTDLTPYVFQYWYAQQTNLILSSFNNRLNSNLYLGLTFKYSFVNK